MFLFLKKLSSTITKLNLDLLANFKPLLASEQSDFKLKVEDLQAKCHTLGHKATGDIMSLKVFCTLCDCMRNTGWLVITQENNFLYVMFSTSHKLILLLDKA